MDKYRNIFLADNQSVLGEGIKQVLLEKTEFYLCGEAFSSQKLLQNLPAQAVDCLVLNLDFSDLPIQQLLEAVFEIHSRLPILMFSQTLEKQMVLKLVDLGVLGFISYDCQKNEFLHALQRVSQGHCYLAPELSDFFVDCLKQSQPKDDILHQYLSHREKQIFQLLAQGEKTQEIAGKLCLSQNTVRTYRSRLMKKLDLKNHTQLVKYAMEHQLL